MSVVVEVRTRRLTVPLHTPFVTALRSTTAIETLLCEIEDADGLVGRGEAPEVWRVTGDSVAGAEACLAGPLRDALLDRPADLESTALVARAVVGNAAAKMAADIALHDLAAQRAGVSLAEHLGGPGGTVRLRTDVTVAAGGADAMADAARARVRDGYGTLKLKVGVDAASDVGRVLAVRDAVGPDVALRLDANQGWDAVSAVEAVRALEDAGAGVELVEQPVPAHDVLGLAWVRERIATPVLADESVFDLVDLVEVLRLGAADLVNVKLAKCGGLTPALELVHVLRSMGVGVLVGSMMESHLGVGAAGALAAACGAAVDLDAAWWATGSPYVGGATYECDLLVLPAAPGLGIELLAEGGSGA